MYFGVFDRESVKSHVVDRREKSASVTQQAYSSSSDQSANPSSQ